MTLLRNVYIIYLMHERNSAAPTQTKSSIKTNIQYEPRQTKRLVRLTARLPRLIMSSLFNVTYKRLLAAIALDDGLSGLLPLQ